MTLQTPRQDLPENETTPLLSTSLSNQETLLQENGSSTISNGSASKDNDEDVPLPKVQMLVLCIARVVEPIAFFGIIPFINKMIWETGGMTEADVGFYSGLIESLFSLTQMCLMILWGRAADRIGRKPILVFSLAGIAMATAVFGFSTTIWQMMLFRCSAGVFAGSIVTIRTMITENSTKKTQARAFSFFAVSGNLGISLGPLIGGALANPADQYPSIFGKLDFFIDHPYALPTIVNGSIGAIAALFSALYLKETLKRKPTDGSHTEQPLKTWEVIKSPGVPNVLFIYGLVMLLGLAYTAVSPLLWFTLPHFGGYGFTPQQISLFLAGIGISQGLWLLVAFPPLQRRYGTIGVLRGCLTVWPILFITAPLCNILLTRDWKVAFWIIAPVTQIGGCGVAMAFTCVQLALNDISPSQTSLGTLNAVALTLVSGVRTIGPPLFTSLFAAGAKMQTLNGYLVWVVLVLVAVSGRISLRWLPEKAHGKIEKPKRLQGPNPRQEEDNQLIRTHT